MNFQNLNKLGWPHLAPILLLIASCSINSYGSGHQEAVPKFSAESLQSHVAVLASDEFEGRGAGYAGEALAADYIAHQFMLAELEPAISVDGKLSNIFSALTCMPWMGQRLGRNWHHRMWWQSCRGVIQQQGILSSAHTMMVRACKDRPP